MNIEQLRQLMAERDSYSILEVLDVSSGERTVLQEFDHVIEAPDWTNDGTRLIYNSEGKIYSYEIATGTSTWIDTGFAQDCNNDHVLSPDNSQIAISHFTNEDVLSRIYTVPIEGGAPILITDRGHSFLHGWSPDGKQLAFCGERDGQFDIYSINLDGSDETQLTNEPGLDDGPEYSPDGKHIWFNSTRSGLMQIWRMNTDGTEPTHMFPEPANCWFPHVSPDSKWVVYIAYAVGDVQPGDHPPNKKVKLMLAPAEGGHSRVIANLFGGQGTINVNSWSPDSQKIAFVSYRLK